MELDNKHLLIVAGSLFTILTVMVVINKRRAKEKGSEMPLDATLKKSVDKISDELTTDLAKTESSKNTA